MITDNYLLANIIILGLGMLVYALYLKKSKDFEFNRWYLVGSLVYSAILPTIRIDAFPQYFDLSGDIPIQAKLANETEIVPGHYWSLDTLYWSITISLLVILVIRTVMTFMSIRRDIKKAREGNYHGPPMSFFNYLLIPETKDKIIYTHESYHCLQGHSWDRLIAEILHCFLWFNPLLFYVKRAIIANHEFAADKNSIQTHQLDKISYLEHMQQQLYSDQKPYLSLYNTYYSLILNRVQMINQEVKIKPMKAAIIPIAAILFSAFALKSYPVTSNPANVSAVGDTIPSSIIIIDTIVAFDMATKKETVSIVENKVNLQTYLAALKYSGEMVNETDTIITFNSDTYVETYEVVNYAYPKEIKHLMPQIPYNEWLNVIDLANAYAKKN